MTGRDGIRIVWKTFKAFANAVWQIKTATVHTFRVERDIARNTDLIRKSEFFDAEWYLENNPDVKAVGMDPARHYTVYAGIKRNPSPYFVGEEYYALHNDVRASRMNPLLHYERYGKREGRPISLLEVQNVSFPEEAVETTRTFARRERVHGRTAIVASYFSNGVIPETLLYLLRGLREVVDNVVYVADCKVLPEEIGKLENLVTIARFERHEQYDFGSYRRGLEITREQGLLEPVVCDELVVINDSNYGPLFPFAESFEVMARRKVDFWGYTGYNAFGNVHISSYFYYFSRKVIDSGKIDEFLSGVQGRIERDKVIVKFEFQFTRFLQEAGFSWDTYVPMGFQRGAPTKYPLQLTRQFRMPLLKAKSVNGDCYDDIDECLKEVAVLNPELSRLIVRKPIESKHEKITYAEHQASFPEKCRLIGEKLRTGNRVKAVFFVSSASMFPLRPLFEEMLKDESFDPWIYAIPDLRWGGESVAANMEQCREQLTTFCPEDRVLMAEQDEFGTWQDVLEGADIAGYPSPYELSSFRYNPHYAVGRNLLPIIANYGYYRSIYDREVMGNQCYAYMWKAFFECEANREEYCRCSAIGGTNVDVVGYIKMDALAKIVPEKHDRKRVMIAPHHSVEGGTNKILSLANFIVYADFFKELPDRYPEIDFVFRPHPFLFKVMSRPNLWGPAKVDAYIADLKTKPNVIWSDGGDYFREFAESDGIIQDCGSYLVEYFYTGKPCCYMLKSPEDIESKFAPLGQDCLRHCYVAYDTAAIDAFLREVIVGGEDVKRAEREEFAKSVMVNYPNAAKVALLHIKEALS